MNLDHARLAPAPGADGLVSRTAGAVLFVSSRTPADETARLVAEVANHDEPAPGRRLARQMATLVGADSGALPGFALIATSTEGLYVKAYGPVEVRVQGDGGTEEVISGVGSFTGVDRELAGTFHTIVAHRAGEAVPIPAFDLDVRAGTTPGNGFALTTLDSPTDAGTPTPPPSSEPEARPASEPMPEPDASEVAPPEPSPPAPGYEPATQAWTAADQAAAVAAVAGSAAAVAAPRVDDPGSPTGDEAPAPPADPVPAPEPLSSEPVTDPPLPPPAEQAPSLTGAGGFSSHLLGALDDEEAEAREPLPLDLEPGEVRAPEQATMEVLVQGVLCSRGHFNDPRSAYCSSCGISMVQNTGVLTQGPRPPLGVLLFEDGATFSLSQDYVVGRQPEVSDLVRDGLALPLPVDDPERSISRAHAEVRLVDWEVHLVNLSATNGSFVWDEVQQQWIPIPTGQSVVLMPGMRVALGRRSAVFESSLRR